LTVAAHLFQTEGYDRTSIDAIAEAANKSKRSIYNHFDGKEDLFAAVIGEELNEVRNALQPVFDRTELPTADRMKQYMIRRMEMLSESSVYKQMLINEVRHRIEPRFVDIRRLCNEFDDWEREQFKRMADEEQSHRSARSARFNSEAFADMTQMVLKSLDISFFVQGRYAQYASTFDTFIEYIVEKLVENHKI
jgi:AcrR family transcriptional regulator